MISRYYICDNCDYHLVVKQELHDEKRLKRCPQCKKNKLYQDLTGQHTYVYSEPKTLGHQAERNTEKFGKYELEHKMREAQKDKDRPALMKLKARGLVKEDVEVLEKPKPFYNPDNVDLTKALSPIINETNPVKKQEKAKKYIVDGKLES